MAAITDNFATKSDVERLEMLIKADVERLEIKIESVNHRLAVIQWIGVIFLALNGSLIATLLWTLASVIVR